jgi:hypothetical protein
MTVIVGLETTAGKKAVVLGSDRAQITKEVYWMHCLGLLDHSSDFDLAPFFDMLERNKKDKCIIGSTSKIDVSPDNQSALVNTGVLNKAHEQISELLLNTDHFLKNTPLLTELLFPMGRLKDEALLQKYLDLYRSSFSLDRNLALGFVPEIRRIFDIHTAGLDVRTLPIFGSIANWDRNYHPVLSEYLFVKRFNGVPSLFEITVTGAAIQRQYYANGCGRNYALSHLRDRLGTCDVSLLYPAESKIKRKVGLEEAIGLVRGAVEYANESVAPFCKGFDYVILTKEGIESHFSDETFSYELNIPQLIERRIRVLNREIKQIRQVRSKYQIRNKSEL